METKVCGIYKLTSPNNKVYIGQSRDIYFRWNDYSKVRCKTQPRLYRSLLKYGVKSFSFQVVSILPKDVDQQILDSYECLYMEQYVLCGIELLNLRGGGANGKMSQESRDKMSQSQKKYFEDSNNRDKARERVVNYRKNNPQKVLEQQRKSAETGKKLEVREKRRQIKLDWYKNNIEKGEIIKEKIRQYCSSEDAREKNKRIQKEIWENAELRNKKREIKIQWILDNPEKFKDNQRKLKEAKQTDEFRNKISELTKGKYVGGKSPLAKKVINTESGEIFSCVGDAAKSIGINCKTLYNKLTGFRINNTKLKYL